ncbi:hypothetical protein [Lactococcus protaetiae]|uniref:Uncharacterized protein n=1 Tax=Lactococcus protaetiae TaxID=2592653 RepID=A0A514Z763_9LACT|nr:hypothetical protein [Lactococcus protaetiae]QDK70327.1 hypothetical protein FLP15_03025 [Lactococcus protaetiae]
MIAEKNLTGKFKFEFSEAVKCFSQWLVSIGQGFSYKEKDYTITAKFECDEDYYNAEAKAIELEGKANPQMSFDLEEDSNGTPPVSE